MRNCRDPFIVSLLLMTLHAQPSAAALQPSAAVQQQSTADHVSELLGPVVEAAVSRALASQQLSGAGAGKRALTELGRLEGRLDAVVHGLAELQLQFGRLEGRLEARGEELDRCRPEPEPVCESHPEPQTEGTGPYLEPAKRACARSCLQLRDGADMQDGVYWLTGLPVPVLCDFSHDGGGWTLLLTVAARDGWNSLSVLKRNERSPSISSNYAILKYADDIRDLHNSSRFAYRIEAKAESGRRRWGGIWLAPRSYSFIHESPSQTNVQRAAKFDAWDYKDNGIEQRMPWLNLGPGSAVLTTSASSTSHWYGTLVTHDTNRDFNFSPWIHQQALHSGRVLYWLREDVV